MVDDIAQLLGRPEEPRRTGELADAEIDQDIPFQRLGNAVAIAKQVIE